MIMTKQPAVFIDRDGTLIEEVNYLSRVGDLRLFPFTAKAIKLLKENGFKIIIVTNQSGIGREIYTETEMHAIHDQIQTELEGAIDAFYFCPHLPCDGCKCRKPGLGMIEAACEDFEIDLRSSWMVGDKKIDIETGFNASIATAFVLTGYGATHKPLLEHPPSLIANDIMEAAKRIVEIKSAQKPEAKIPFQTP